MSLTQCHSLLDREKVFEENLAYLSKELPLYVHCDGGERAEEAANFFITLGFQDVR